MENVIVREIKRNEIQTKIYELDLDAVKSFFDKIIESTKSWEIKDFNYTDMIIKNYEEYQMLKKYRLMVEEHNKKIVDNLAGHMKSDYDRFFNIQNIKNVNLSTETVVATTSSTKNIQKKKSIFGKK